MEGEALISVIIPVYNAEKYLRICLDSLRAQEYMNTEFIMVNDGSTDNSVRICDEYLAADSRFKLLSQDNSGPSAARNAGLKVAHGEYISFVDADDWIQPNFLSVLYRELTDNGADISYCDFALNGQKVEHDWSDGVFVGEFVFQLIMDGGGMQSYYKQVIFPACDRWHIFSLWAGHYGRWRLDAACLCQG